MNSVMESVRNFLESIPQFISDLEPDNDYLKAPNMPEGSWKALDKYTIEETTDGKGFTVSGRLAVPLVDLITFTGWHVYKAAHPDILDDRLYEMYLVENSQVVSEFNLEEFCDTFNDFYCEFLNDSGISDDSLELDGNTVTVLVYDKESDGLTDDVEDDDEEDSAEPVEEDPGDEDSEED